MRELQTATIANKKDGVSDFLYRCRQFLITICEEIKNRYNLRENNLFSKVAWLNPEVAISTNQQPPISIEPLIKEVTRMVSPKNLNSIQVIYDQWKKLPQ